MDVKKAKKIVSKDLVSEARRAMNDISYAKKMGIKIKARMNELDSIIVRPDIMTALKCEQVKVSQEYYLLGKALEKAV